jgi:hypothetical protein
MRIGTSSLPRSRIARSAEAKGARCKEAIMSMIIGGRRRIAAVIAAAIATALTWTLAASPGAASAAPAAAAIPKCSPSDLGAWVAADQMEG